MSVHPSHTPGGDLVDRLADLVGGRAGATAVYGPPVERDGVTVIPVAGTRFGFGGGGGPTPDGKGEGVGGGGGAASRPLGFIEIRGGRARFRRVVDPVTLGVAILAIAVAAAILSRAARRLGAGRCPACESRKSETPASSEDGTDETPSP